MKHIALVLNIVRLRETFLITKLSTEEEQGPKCLLSKFCTIITISKLTVYLCHAMTNHFGSLIFISVVSYILVWIFGRRWWSYSRDRIIGILQIMGIAVKKILSAVYGCLQTLMIYSDCHSRKFNFIRYLRSFTLFVAKFDCFF